jgi:hypothetical protein
VTLVLSCLTPRFVLQVSDRLLVDVRTGKPLPGKDEVNKAVLFMNRISFAYTGLAQIGLQPTDAWLADTLASEDDPTASFERLALAATDYFRRAPVPLAWKRHAFVAVGWNQWPERWPDWKACIFCVSNCLDDQWRWQAVPSDHFTMRGRVLPPREAFLLASAGQPLKHRERVALLRQLRRFVPRTSPAAVADLLVEQVRAVALRNPAVGQGVLVNAIPLLPEAFESGAMLALSSRPTLTEQTFSYLPAGDTREVELAPRVAAPGGAQIESFEAVQGPNEGDVTVTMKFRTPRSLSGPTSGA